MLQDEPGHPRTGELPDVCREKLAATVLGVGNGADIIMQFGDGERRISMVLPPNAEKVGDGAAPGIVGLCRRDADGWIGATQSQERIPAPPTPRPETAKRPSDDQIGGILPSPPPNGQNRLQHLATTGQQFRHQVALEWSGLRILKFGVQFHDQESAGQVFGEGEPVPRHGDEGGGVQ